MGSVCGNAKYIPLLDRKFTVLGTPRKQKSCGRTLKKWLINEREKEIKGLQLNR